MGFRGGGGKLTPPSVSWFSSTPAGIGLKCLPVNESVVQSPIDGPRPTAVAVLSVVVAGPLIVKV